MSVKTEEDRVEWLLPFTVADQMVIESLGERERAAVERYLRVGGGVVNDVRALTDDELVDKIADAVEVSIDVRSDVEHAVSSALRRFRREQRI